jgi:hypothetical protein
MKFHRKVPDPMPPSGDLPPGWNRFAPKTSSGVADGTGKWGKVIRAENIKPE